MRAVLTLLAMFGALLFASEANANAFLFQFDDLTETVVGNFYVNGQFQNSVFCNSPTESCGFGLSQGGGQLSGNFTDNFNILEADGTLSDTLSVTGSNVVIDGTPQAEINVSFLSDIEGLTLTPLVNATSINETGDWQDPVGTITIFDLSGAPLHTVDVQFRSDAPEPLTLSLFGAGLVGTALLRRRKRKSV
jgi:hypothetical protein